ALPRDGRQLPLAFAQQRLWFLEQLDGGSAAYNIVAPTQLDGPVRKDLLEAALSEIVRRHEVLRTAFVVAGGSPVQAIAPPLPVRVPTVDLAALPEAVRNAATPALARREARRPFDLALPSPLRPILFRLSDRPGAQSHLFELVMHHIVTDLWSIDLLLREMTVLYGAFVAGRPSLLLELAI